MKTRWIWLLAAAFLAAVTLYLFGEQIHRRGFHWNVFLATLRDLDWRWLALACGLALATYYGRALRWAVFLKPIKPHPNMGNLFRATAIGYTALTLLGRPGEFVRPYLIALKERVPLSSQLAAWFLERLFDLLFALLVFGWGLSRVRSSDIEVGPGLSWVLAMGGRFVAFFALLAVALLVLFRNFSQHMQRRLLDSLEFLPKHHFDRADRLVRHFVQGVESTRCHKSMALLAFYTTLEWTLIAGCYVCIIRAFGAVLPYFSLIDVLIFMGFVSFGAVVQVPGVGGGTQVVSVLVLTELFDTPLEVATSLALLVWAVTFVVIVPFGLGLAFHEGLNWGKLRHIQEEVEE